MQLISAILPVLLISILGYCLVRFRFIPAEGSAALSKLTFSILIPCLLFRGVTEAKLSNIFYFEFLAAYFIPVAIVFVAAAIIGRVVFSYGALQQSMFSIGASYSNATILSIPVCLYALGEKSLVPLSIIVTFHNFVLFTLGIFSAERGALSLANVFAHLRRILISFFSNPITMSLIAGVLVNALKIPVPKVLLDAIGFLSEAAVPMAFLILGSSISGYGVRGQLAPVAFIVLIKLLLLPYLVWFFAFDVFSLDLLWAKTAVAIAAAPVGIATYAFSQRYNSGESLLASSIIISTVLSVFSISFWLKWIGA